MIIRKLARTITGALIASIYLLQIRFWGGGGGGLTALTALTSFTSLPRQTTLSPAESESRRQRIAPFDLRRASLPVAAAISRMFLDTLCSKKWYDLPHIGCGINSLQRSTISPLVDIRLITIIGIRVVLYLYYNSAYGHRLSVALISGLYRPSSGPFALRNVLKCST